MGCLLNVSEKVIILSQEFGLNTITQRQAGNPKHVLETGSFHKYGGHPLAHANVPYNPPYSDQGIP